MSRRNVLVDSLVVLMAGALIGGCAAGAGPDEKVPPGPMVVGEEVSKSLRSPAYTAPKVAGHAQLIWQEELHHADATYIAAHFAKFSLPEGAHLVVRTPDGNRQVRYAGTGKNVPAGEGFWATHMPGNRAILELHSSVSLGQGAVELDRFARGLDAWTKLGDDIAADLISKDYDSEAICGADDSEWAKCYQSSEPTVYDESRAVARLMINGSSGCTGWLVGSEGHVMTNEHCIGSSSSAANTDFEFMAEGATCGTDCSSWGACPGDVVASSSTLVKKNASLDYTLVKLPTNPSGTYGYMQMRETGGVVGERIYIPQHPAVWGKRIAMKAGADDATITSKSSPACSSGAPVPDVGYFADTQGGSSGSPVLAYDDHLVVALHHCANCPNRGVPIEAIVDDLQASNDVPNDAIGNGCTPQPIADAGPDRTICLGETTTIGTPAEPDHTYSWSPGGATTAQVDVSPSTTTTYTVTATTSCGSKSDSVIVSVDTGAGGFNDDFEGDISGWSLSGLWHKTTSSSCASPGYSSPVSALYYGQDSSCDYRTGSTSNSGSATSPTIGGITTSSALTFQYFRQVESYNGNYDETIVEVSSNGGASWNEVWKKNSRDASASAWTSSGSISLGAYAGSNIQIRFRFNTVDSISNNFTGWFIDDVDVSGSSSCPAL
ncbi:MAG: trypsin-like peptidase domain-containing protein [Proteobacteria bacterium]|nr:trypsin-like peptidase domain-containing protein [Pseudomonadota bacterium]